MNNSRVHNRVKVSNVCTGRSLGGESFSDPTMYPGLGSPRCPRCLSLLEPQAGELISPALRDSAAVAGTGIGAMLSAVYGLDTGIPCLQNRLRGPKWLPWVVGIPPLLLFSGASSAFGGYALPRFAQITMTSYYAISSASHHWVSRLTGRIEESHTSRTDDKLPK